jgi:acrylyl-CoA reductase (NADPH)
MAAFNAYQVERAGDEMVSRLLTRETSELPEHDTLIEVLYSSVNYKDALSANGAPGVTKHYPHTPGIDAAGIVVSSDDPQLNAGDEVIVIGFDLGMNTPGGYGQFIRVPGEWVTPLPAGLSLRESMILGTAGLTAALCVEKLLWMNASPEQGPVVVTGATGGVGSVAVALLANLGFEVTASTGKESQFDFLRALGATEVIHRDELSEASNRPLLVPRFAHGVDTVGGVTLSNVVKQLEPRAVSRYVVWSPHPNLK